MQYWGMTLTDRWHFVHVDDKTSDRRRVNFGVPQGSIMGPLVFNLCFADRYAHVNVQCHQYAYDTTLYVHCKPSNLESYKRDLQPGGGGGTPLYGLY